MASRKGPSSTEGREEEEKEQEQENNTDRGHYDVTSCSRCHDAASSLQSNISFSLKSSECSLVKTEIVWCL